MKTTFKILFTVIALGAVTFSSAKDREIKNPTCKPEILVRQAFAKVSKNYPDHELYMRAQYKESIRKDGEYISANEVQLDIEKASYKTSREDAIIMNRSRGNNKQQEMDKIYVKYQGGPNSSLLTDVVKNPFLGCDIYSLSDLYEFSYDDPKNINGEDFYIVNFDQKYNNDDILYRGRIFIEANSLAIARIEFNMNVENRGDAFKLFLKNRPKVKMDVDYAKYIVVYKKIEDKWFLANAYSDVKVTLSSRKKGIYSSYNLTSALNVKDIQPNLASLGKGDEMLLTESVSDKLQGSQPGRWVDFGKIVLALNK